MTYRTLQASIDLRERAQKFIGSPAARKLTAPGSLLLAACLLATAACAGRGGADDATRADATVATAATQPVAAPASLDDLAPEFDVLAWYAAREQRAASAQPTPAAPLEDSEGDETEAPTKAAPAPQKRSPHTKSAAIDADAGRRDTTKRAPGEAKRGEAKRGETGRAAPGTAKTERARKNNKPAIAADAAEEPVTQQRDGRGSKSKESKTPAAKAFDPAMHAALVATLEPRRVFVSHNPDKPFNPASLVKLATSLAALRRLGADYRFEVRAEAAGEIDGAGVLRGDLRFSGSIPTFNELAAKAIADELARLGVRGVTGKITVTPDFCFNFSDSPEQSAALLAGSLRLGGKRQSAVETSADATPKAKELFTLRSQPLHEILLYMNTHSSNFVAHRVGDRVGGAVGVRQLLIDDVGLAPEQVVLSTTSGLEHNEMTARGLLAVLRSLTSEARAQKLRLVDLLPVANERRSTLRHRFLDNPLKDAVAAKTGTLRDIDGGVANLAGVIETQDAGEVAFVLLDGGTDLAANRLLQDELLAAAVGERLRLLPIEVPADRVLLDASGLIVQSQMQSRDATEQAAQQAAQ